MLLPLCELPNSSPASIIGVPSDSISVPSMFMAACSRLRMIAGSSDGPSTPKFAEWFTFDPSILTAYRVRSVSVNPSWHET